MKAIVKKFTSKENYEQQKLPESIETIPTVSEALILCKKDISKAKKAEGFLGYRIYDVYGKEKYKLPSY